MRALCTRYQRECRFTVSRIDSRKTSAALSTVIDMIGSLSYAFTGRDLRPYGSTSAMIRWHHTRPSATSPIRTNPDNNFSVHRMDRKFKISRDRLPTRLVMLYVE